MHSLRLTLAATCLALLQPGPVKAQLPPAGSLVTGNINRPLRLTSGTPVPVAVLSVAFPDLVNEPLGGHLIDAQTQVQIAQDLEALALNNSYGRYAIDVKPDTVAEAADYRITMPEGFDTAYYLSIPKPDRAIALVSDIKEAFLHHHPNLPQGLDLEAFTRVCYYFRDGQLPLPYQCTPGLIHYPLELSAGAQVGYVSMTHLNGMASALYHEIGHTYGAGHANCWETAKPLTAMGMPNVFKLDMAFCSSPPQRACNQCMVPGATCAICVKGLGDPFDYMGMGGWCCAPRIDIEKTSPISPSNPNGFQTEVEMHVNPVRKWQQGWLNNSEVEVVTKNTVNQTGVYVLRGIDRPISQDGPRAIDIPRGNKHWDLLNAQVGGENDPRLSQSWFVYYRDNEPKVDDGVSIALVTKERLGVMTRTVDFDYGQPLAPCPCQGEPVTHTYCEDSALHVGRLFVDDVTGVVIQMLAVDKENGLAMVGIEFTNPINESNAHTPVVNIISPKLQAEKILHDETAEVQVEAYDPDALPPPFTNYRWAGIASVRVKVFVGSQTISDQTFDNLTAGSAALTINADLTAATTGPVQRIGAVFVNVTAQTGEVNTGYIRFVLDQRGPFSW